MVSSKEEQTRIRVSVYDNVAIRQRSMDGEFVFAKWPPTGETDSLLVLACVLVFSGALPFL